MFKKFKNNGNNTDTVFLPHDIDTQCNKKSNTSHKANSLIIQDVVSELINNQEFINLISSNVSNIILNKLVDQYDFMPTDKYIAEKNQKQEYLAQLDQYLNERKQINQDVNRELDNFLKDTKLSLMQALESFSHNLEARIKDVEAKHEINVINKILFDETADA